MVSAIIMLLSIGDRSLGCLQPNHHLRGIARRVSLPALCSRYILQSFHSLSSFLAHHHILWLIANPLLSSLSSSPIITSIPDHSPSLPPPPPSPPIQLPSDAPHWLRPQQHHQAASSHWRTRTVPGLPDPERTQGSTWGQWQTYQWMVPSSFIINLPWEWSQSVFTELAEWVCCWGGLYTCFWVWGGGVLLPSDVL